MRRKRQFNAGVRLSDKERIIVRYIVSQLETAYRNSAGKPVYARNMDQVMNDIFGVKKFTKTLERGRYNEAIMIGLMRQLDAATMWQICRSKEHYKLLCTLVALDAYIVDKRKKFDKMLQLEPTDRPTKKMRKLKSQAKKAAKLYKACIKTFRDVFDIKKVSSGGGEMFDILNDWLDDHTGGDDIFFDMDRGFSVDDVESMDEYIRGRRGGRRSNGSALGLDFDSGDEDDLLDDGEDIGNASLEDLLMELNSRGVDIRPLVTAYQKKGPQQRRTAQQPDIVFDDFDDDEPVDNGDNSYMAQLIRTMAEGFDSLRNDIASMGGGRPRPATTSTYAGSPLERMMDASNPSDEDDDGPLDPEPVFTDNLAEEPDDPNRPVPGGEVEPEA